MGAGASATETKVKPFRQPDDADLDRRKSLARKPKSADSIMSRLRQRSKGRSSAGTSRTVASASKVKTPSSAKSESGSVDSGRGSLSRQASRSDNNLASADSSALASTASSLSSAVLQPRARTLPPIMDESFNRPQPVDTSKILESLREEGLLESTSKGVSGLCYELPLDDLQPAKRDRLPPHLARLERQKEMDLTKAKLKERLDAAEQRRKARDCDKQRRVRDRDEKNLQVKLALLEIDKGLEEQQMKQLDQTMDQAAQRRHSAKREVMSRQQTRQQRALEVKERKLSLSKTSQEIADIMDC